MTLEKLLSSCPFRGEVTVEAINEAGYAVFMISSKTFNKKIVPDKYQNCKVLEVRGTPSGTTIEIEG